MNICYSAFDEMLPGNFFGLILKNKMAITGIFRLSAKTFWCSRAKGITVRDLKLQDIFIITKS